MLYILVSISKTKTSELSIYFLNASVGIYENHKNNLTFSNCAESFRFTFYYSFVSWVTEILVVCNLGKWFSNFTCAHAQLLVSDSFVTPWTV